MICKVSVAVLYFVENNREGVSFNLQSLSPQIYFSHITTDANSNLKKQVPNQPLKHTNKKKTVCDPDS